MARIQNCAGATTFRGCAATEARLSLAHTYNIDELGSTYLAKG